MNKQYDIFGNEVDFEKITPPKPTRKFKTMQQTHGTLEGFKCGDCKHFIRQNYHYRNYFKCELWKMSNSEATDIRIKNTACRKYEEIENE